MLGTDDLGRIPRERLALLPVFVRDHRKNAGVIVLVARSNSLLDLRPLIPKVREKAALRNPYRRAAILESKRTLYAA